MCRLVLAFQKWGAVKGETASFRRGAKNLSKIDRTELYTPLATYALHKYCQKPIAFIRNFFFLNYANITQVWSDKLWFLFWFHVYVDIYIFFPYLCWYNLKLLTEQFVSFMKMQKYDPTTMLSMQKYDPTTMLSMQKYDRSTWLHWVLIASDDSVTCDRRICMLPSWLGPRLGPWSKRSWSSDLWASDYGPPGPQNYGLELGGVR